MTISRRDAGHGAVSGVKVNGIELVYDTFGDPADRPLLLIMGLGGQMITWDEEFCRQLAEEGLWVIRFDNRDVGLSTCLDQYGTPHVLGILQAVAQGEPVEVPYLLKDMAADAVGLLDALGLPSANVLGVSMGGMIAQEIAIHYPERVRSLISIMSSTGDPSLPQPTPEATALLVAPSPREKAAYVDWDVEVWRILGSPGFPLDEAKIRKRAAEAFDRGLNPPGFARQLAAILASGSRQEELRDVQIPTLVIHGKADPLVPEACGIDTAEHIPGARLVLIEGMGHDLPVEVWPRIIKAVSEIVS